MLKQCSKCGEVKPYNQFYRNSGSPDGYRPDCKACEGKPRATPQERFWRHVDKRGPDECWAWVGYMDARNKYGRFRVGSRKLVASRYAYELEHGPIPEGLEVCHKCDNPKCVNPQHLFLGTHIENMADASNKGRIHPLRGEANPRAKLTTTQAREIREAYRAGGMSQRDLARRYGLCQRTIGVVVRELAWGESL